MRGVPVGCRAGGAGGWSARGCEVVFRNQSHVSCQCNHMTSFAVLMDISRREVGTWRGGRGCWDGTWELGVGCWRRGLWKVGGAR